jgi:hypothetical protein
VAYRILLANYCNFIRFAEGQSHAVFLQLCRKLFLLVYHVTYVICKAVIYGIPNYNAYILCFITYTCMYVLYMQSEHLRSCFRIKSFLLFCGHYN